MNKSSFFVRLGLPEATEPSAREALSEILTRVASRFSFQGLEDWQVDLPSHVKVLGAEREFHDLTQSAAMNLEIRVYFEKKADAQAYGRLIKASFDEIKVYPARPLAKRDWMKEWRKFYKTQKVEAGGRTVYIVPAWKKAPKNSLSVKIHPGQAFGTGTHPTTRLCIEAFLAAWSELPEKVRLLDFGSGTGVLALVAESLAAKEKRQLRSVAVESDPDALVQCGKNARLNRRKVRLLRKLPKGKFDFIFANVLAPVLVKHKAELAARLAPGALVVVSGILAKEAGQFQRDFAVAGLERLSAQIEGDWAGILYGKK